MSTIRRDLLEILGLFFCSLAIFTWGLSSQEIIGFDSRFYLFAQEMLRHGPSWFPTTYNQPYPDYTGASTFLIFIAAKLFGSLNKFTAVLPSSILAATTVVLTFLTGSLQNKRWGFYAVFFLLFSLAFYKNARAISLDMYTTALTTTCFYLVYSADLKNKPQRIRWIYLLLFLGFIFRGPIGLVIPTGVVCIYYLLDKNFKNFFLTGFLATLIFIFCSILLLSLAWHVGGDTFVYDVMRMQMLGRIDNHYLPRYFYFTNSLKNYAISFPLVWLVLFGLCYGRLTNRALTADRKFLLKLFGWMLIILLGMSVPDDKKVRYLLPMVPAMALIAAYPFVASAKENYFIVLRWILSRIFLILPGVLSVTLLILFIYADKHALHFGIHYLYVGFFLLAMQIIAIVFFYKATHKTSALLAIGTLSFLIANMAVIEPIELYIDRAQDFVFNVETARLHQRAQLVFYKERPDSLPIKYLINMPYTTQPRFINNQQDLASYPAPTYFVTSATYFDELPKEISALFHVVAKDSLGHVPVVVFSNIG